MRLIQLIASLVFRKSLGLLLLFPVLSQAQPERETKGGMSLSLEIDKELSRFFSASLEEEVRITNNTTGFDRNITALGVNYSLLEKKMKIGAYYAFIYLYNNDYLFEPRRRYYANISYKTIINYQYTLSWRGRFQGTYRDENRGEYKINPKYVMKNKFELEYMIWGSPWKPFLSCDWSTTLNDPLLGYELTRARFQGGTEWRLNRTGYLNFFVRYDRYLSGDDPHVLAVGITYRIKLF
jgi:hypothetical protein